MHHDTYTTPEGFELPRRLLFPEVTDFAELFTAEKPWDFATMNHKHGRPQPDTPREIRRDGWEKTVSRFCAVRVPGRQHLQVTPTDLVLDRIYDPEALDFAFFDRVSFEAIHHPKNDRVLIVASASGIIASRWLAYVHTDTVPVLEVAR